MNKVLEAAIHSVFCTDFEECPTEDGLEVEVIRIEKINELLDLADSWLTNSVYKTVDVKPSF